jgi:hypothetical protein
VRYWSTQVFRGASFSFFTALNKGIFNGLNMQFGRSGQEILTAPRRRNAVEGKLWENRKVNGRKRNLILKHIVLIQQVEDGS